MRSLLALLFLAACDPTATEAPPPGPDSAQALKATFEAFVADVQARKDPAAAARALEAYLLEEKEFSALLAPDLAARAWPGYRDVVAGKLRAEAGAVLVREIVEQGRTEVEVEAVGPGYPAATTRGDEALVAALVTRQPVYTVRLQKPGDALGLRLNGFLYHQGRWRALFKAYEHFAPAAAPESAEEVEGAAPESAAPESAAPESVAPESAAPASAAPLTAP